jgi:hypothetical protein
MSDEVSILRQKNSGSVQCIILLGNKYAKLEVSSHHKCNILKDIINLVMSSQIQDTQARQIGNNLHPTASWNKTECTAKSEAQPAVIEGIKKKRISRRRAQTDADEKTFCSADPG